MRSNWPPYIGWLMHRSWGGFVADTLFVLPSLFILIALSWIYLRFDLFAATITVLAAVALFRFKLSVMPLMGACAVAGLTVHWFR